MPCLNLVSTNLQPFGIFSLTNKSLEKTIAARDRVIAIKLCGKYASLHLQNIKLTRREQSY